MEKFVLTEEQQNRAKEIVLNNRKKNNCNICYDRGYVGFTEEKTLVPCHKCVDDKGAMNEWKEYALSVPVLAEYYADFFKELEEEK